MHSPENEDLNFGLLNFVVKVREAAPEADSGYRDRFDDGGIVVAALSFAQIRDKRSTGYSHNPMLKPEA